MSPVEADLRALARVLRFMPTQTPKATHEYLAALPPTYQHSHCTHDPSFVDVDASTCTGSFEYHSTIGLKSPHFEVLVEVTHTPEGGVPAFVLWSTQYSHLLPCPLEPDEACEIVPPIPHIRLIYRSGKPFIQTHQFPRTDAWIVRSVIDLRSTCAM